MEKLNPVERSRYIDTRYKEYLRSSFQFGKGVLQNLFKNELSKEALLKGPYVALNLPFQRGKCIEELIEDGIVCQSFKKLNDISFTRPLYVHQEDAIRQIGSGKGAIVTTGTGSGKTECFLYPILNELMFEVENGNREVGIRAIFLYPMNALVNDQIDRVRKILTGCSEITYGFFTGDTPETIAKNYREKYGEGNGGVIPENELVSRKEIRDCPPHLLFTNYSMLEYLLIRPDDYAIFSPERLHNWKYVVMDEAHTYYGSLGIEISMLMRRLTALATQKPRFILTSATLGEQGKSETEIIEFAKNLTSAKFEQSDIIFAERIPLKQDVLYSVNGQDYILMKKYSSDKSMISSICQKYHSAVGADIASSIYELLCHDKHVHQIYEFLKSDARIFSEMLISIDDISDTELIALIDLINFAEDDGVGLFDLKYHSFVRPLSGAYVTMGNPPTLNLTKTNNIGEMKAFEIGNCRFCNSPYIIGKIQHNSADQLDYLFQNKEVDIYENYGNNEFVKIDYFLMENSINEDEVDKESLEEYTLCAKCGCIHPAANLNARVCGCGDAYKKIVYRVGQSKKDDAPEVFNNINQCPCCGHKSRSGIVKSLSLGKDEGTALIAQTLYEAIDEGSVAPQKKRKLSLKLGTKKPGVSEETTKVKQFLEFSDSRQQASFAAVFFDSNHVRMLRKRLIWKVIEEQDYRPLTVDELAANLSALIKGEELFQNNLSVHKNAWVTLLVDLLKVDGSYDGEGLGLYYFDPDLSEIMCQIDEADVKEEFGNYNITKSDLETIMKVVLGVFKITPAIEYVKSTLTPDEKLENLDFRRFDNYIMYICPKALKGIRSFLPVKGKSNMVVRYVKKVCRCDEAAAMELLNVIFNNLAVEGGLLKKHPSKDAYQIEASKYIVRNYKGNKFYRCSKCGRLTPYNVHNVCVQDSCDGILSEMDPDVVLENNYYRNQYKNKKIERIVIKEHTAQLDRKKAKEYQNDFKNKKINILSCSTTFEMGIDIGTLETVFMRNVPPTPANYVQRAGRAGRRRDSSAYILTYCGTGSHDYTYFMAPEKMISGVIKPPYFNVLNKKIIVRHLMASCLGFFFRQNQSYFKTVDEIVFGDGLETFRNYIQSRPDDLNHYINECVLPESIYSEYHDFKWFEEMGDDDEKLRHFVDVIQQMAKEFDEAKNQALKEERYTDADYYTHQIENLHKARVIDSLSKYCVIPKYGFPVDLVELQIYDRGKLDNSYDLSRDLKIAISEYAPDSEVIVDGKKYTSKYISLPKSSPFPKHYFCTCSNCKKINVYLSADSSKTCKYCGEPISAERSEYYIEPVNGFKTGLTKESTRMKPKRSYAGEVSYFGGGNVGQEHFELGDSMIIETSTDDELLILNRSEFYMCPVCGYSDISKGRTNTPIRTTKHKNFRQYDCENEKLTQLRLGHSFQTDVARFKIPILHAIDGESYAQALSFIYAFLEGISNAMGIERNDIDGILELNLDLRSYDILIYDNVPGGAGHVKRLVNRDAIISSLRAALSKVSQNCCDENTSCYNCLRNYYNQAYHSRLKRVYAKEILEMLLNDLSYVHGN